MDRRPTGASSEARTAAWVRIATGVLVTILAVVVHVRMLLHAGALWRDEVNGVNVAAMPTLGQLWRNLEFESFPAAWLLLLRGWRALGLADSDLGLRVLGLLAGLSLIAVLWLAARRLGIAAPILALVLCALNPTVVRWGDSVRGYGFSAVLIVLALCTVWQLADAPSRWRMVVASVTAVFCVQFSYQNAFLLLGVCMGAIVVSLRRGSPRRAAASLAVGAIAAVSLLPYVAIVRAQADWAPLNRSDPGLSQLGQVAGQNLVAQHPWMPFVWIALGLMAAGILAGVVARPGCLGETQRQRDGALFAVTAAGVGLVAFFVFLLRAGYPTQPWYYLTLITICAIGFDAALAPWLRSPRAAIVQACLAAVVVALSIGPLWTAAGERFTNVDHIASTLVAEARPGDLIVVTPWYAGISFGYYYDGHANWTMLPAIADTRVHRYDLLKQRMASPDAITPVLQRVVDTLRHGDRVWIVRLTQPLQRGRAPLALPPAPSSPYGWTSSPYNVVWSSQLDHLLYSNPVEITDHPVASSVPVSPFEAARLQAARAFR